jgi:flagellar P-ring protein precursor FlgI
MNKNLLLTLCSALNLLEGVFYLFIGIISSFYGKIRFLIKKFSTLDDKPNRRFVLSFLQNLLVTLLIIGKCEKVSALIPHLKAVSRIKDIVEIESVRPNQLIGYGLIVGLNGTGDSLKKSPFTKESLTGMLERMGINTRDSGIDTKNTAAVIVTANLPPFGKPGTKIDVSIASLGDCKNLLGGTLLVTPLMGADGAVYAVAQGQVVASGFSASGSKGGTSITKGVPTSGYIPNGAIVEKEIGFEFNKMDQIRLLLRNPDFTTAQRVANTINKYVEESTAQALDAGTIRLTIPLGCRGNIVPFITEIESLKVEPDQVARVIMDDREGILVIGENVRISTVAIAQGSLVVRITETPVVSQPGAFSDGSTEVVTETSIAVNDGDGKRVTILKEGPTLRDLVEGLNALGLSAREIISLLQSVKAAGALQAEV